MSMFKSFFEINTDPRLFEELDTGKERVLCEAHMGKYPVILLSLKGIEDLSFKDAISAVRTTLQKELLRYQYLLDSQKLSEIEKQIFLRMPEYVRKRHQRILVNVNTVAL